MTPEEEKQLSEKLKKQLRLNRRLSKMLYEKLKESLIVTQENQEGMETLDKIDKKLDEDYNNIMKE